MMVVAMVQVMVSGPTVRVGALPRAHHRQGEALVVRRACAAKDYTRRRLWSGGRGRTKERGRSAPSSPTAPSPSQCSADPHESCRVRDGEREGLRRLGAPAARRGPGTVRTEARERPAAYKLGGELGAGVARHRARRRRGRQRDRCERSQAERPVRHRARWSATPRRTTPPLARREPVIAWVVSEMCERVLSWSMSQRDA